MVFPSAVSACVKNVWRFRFSPPRLRFSKHPGFWAYVLKTFVQNDRLHILKNYSKFRSDKFEQWFFTKQMAKTCLYWLSIMTMMMKDAEKWANTRWNGQMECRFSNMRLPFAVDASNIPLKLRFTRDCACKASSMKNWFKSAISDEEVIFSRRLFFRAALRLSLDKIVCSRSSHASNYDCSLQTERALSINLFFKSLFIHFLLRHFSSSFRLALLFFSSFRYYFSVHIALMFLKMCRIVTKCVIHIHILTHFALRHNKAFCFQYELEHFSFFNSFT